MRRLYHLMESWSELMETGNTPPVDIFPWLKLIPGKLFGDYKSRAFGVGQQMEDLYEDTLSAVLKRRETRRLGSFMDVVLDQQDKIQLPREQLRFIGGVLMEGGSDTSSSLILAIVQALILNPVVQEKAHREIAAVVGDERSPVWADMPNLPYINMIVKEGHRWRPILPLCFPHALGQGKSSSPVLYMHMLRRALVLTSYGGQTTGSMENSSPKALLWLSTAGVCIWTQTYGKTLKRSTPTVIGTFHCSPRTTSLAGTGRSETTTGMGSGGGSAPACT